MWNKTLAELNR